MSYVLSAVREEVEKNHQAWLQQGLEQGLKEGEHRKAIAIAAIAKQLLAEGRSPAAVQKLTGLPEKEVMDLVEAH
ncbi:MAG: hypothetical protein RJA83_1167 [Pseudomonadota bacterium]|jgi:transcription initiation factor TFIIIB Brf1 subunit/transcription initiation factor TFIIB